MTIDLTSKLLYNIIMKQIQDRIPMTEFNPRVPPGYVVKIAQRVAVVNGELVIYDVTSPEGRKEQRVALFTDRAILFDNIVHNYKRDQ